MTSRRYPTRREGSKKREGPDGINRPALLSLAGNLTQAPASPSLFVSQAPDTARAGSSL